MNLAKRILLVIFLTVFSGAISSASAQLSYRFDNDALVDGCGRFTLQERSRDKRHELIVKLQVDSLSPASVYYLDATDKYLKISFNHYPKDNCCLNRICNDVGKHYDKEPVVYYAISGKIIVKVSAKDEYGRFRVSVVLTDIKLRDAKSNTIYLPHEALDNVRVGWYPG